MQLSDIDKQGNLSMLLSSIYLKLHQFSPLVPGVLGATM